jgi:BioD-like phosphotransacetylase family protein
MAYPPFNLILDEQNQIEDALQQYFSNIGNHANNMQDVDNFKDNVRKKVAKPFDG